MSRPQEHPLATHQIQVADVSVTVIRKRIKTLRLTVNPPDGHVKVSVPLHVSEMTTHQFVASRLDWIKRHQDRLRAQSWPGASQYVTGETHFFNGEPFQLEVVYRAGRPSVTLCDKSHIVLVVAPGSDIARRERVLQAWYRAHLQAVVPALIAKWESQLRVSVAEWRIRRMKTRWGTCSIRARRIWLNLDLARKSPACLEYLVVHEMVHLLERRHNARFYALMDRHLPDWRVRRAELNRNDLGGCA